MKTNKLKNCFTLYLTPLIIFAFTSSYLVYDHSRKTLLLENRLEFLNQVQYPYLIVGIITYILAVAFYWIYSYKIESKNKDLILKGYNLFLIIFSIKMFIELSTYLSYMTAFNTFMLVLLILINIANIANLVLIKLYKKDKPLKWNKKENIFLSLIVFYDLYSYLTHRGQFMETTKFDYQIDPAIYTLAVYITNCFILLVILIVTIYIFISKKIQLNFKLEYSSILLTILLFNLNYVLIASSCRRYGLFYTSLYEYFELIFDVYLIPITLIPIALFVVNLIFLTIYEVKQFNSLNNNEEAKAESKALEIDNS